MSNKRDLKAFVRFDGSGRIVAGSLILRKNKPKVGKWHEIQAYECCNYIPSSTTTTTTQGGGGTPTVFIESYWLNTEDACSTTTYGNLLFYSASPVLGPGVAIFTDAALTIPVTAGLVIYISMTDYLVGAGGVLSELVCPELGPSINITSITNITSSSADFTFNFSPTDGSVMVAGVALSTMPNPNRNSMPRNSIINPTTSPNTISVGPLNPSTFYYVIAWIQIGMNTYYSTETTIVTPN